MGEGGEVVKEIKSNRGRRGKGGGEEEEGEGEKLIRRDGEGFGQR